LTTTHETALLLRTVNERIAVMAADFEQPGLEAEWEFHCECGDEACEEWVSMQLAEFGAIAHERGAFVLAPDHPVPRARRARQRAGELREAAEALRAQSLHQQRRARRQRSG
jgi:hypothetical protein